MKLREDKNSEYNQLLQEAIIYFKKYPVFHKIFSGFCKKYESLGHLGGTVVIKNLTKDEKMQLSGFFQRDFYKNKTISISMQRMEKALKTSRNQRRYEVSKEGSLSGKYVGELYIAIRMKKIKSRMYDVNKKFHISYMGDF